MKIDNINSFDYEFFEKERTKLGNSFFYFDEEKFRENIKLFSESFEKYIPNSKIAYSYKTNYLPEVIRIIKSQGLLSEVVSGFEMQLAINNEVQGNDIIFNGPLKMEEELRQALIIGATINIDSYEEILEIEKIINKYRLLKPANVAIRCNLKTSDLLESRFGIDANSIQFKQTINVIEKSNKFNFVGLHGHLPNRDLQNICQRVELLFEISKGITSLDVKSINIGGGFMSREIPRESSLTHISFTKYAAEIAKIYDRIFESSKNKPSLLMEPGTALISDCFYYITRINNIKKVQNRYIATVDGTNFEMNPNSKLPRLPMKIVSDRVDEGEERSWDVCGYTCVESDFLSKNLIANLRIGDYLIYACVGSYSLVMKPPFIRPASAIFTINTSKSEISLLRKKQTYEDVMSGFM